MRITVNGEQKTFRKDLTIALLISKYRLKKESVAVELNHKIIKKADYEKSILRDNDRVEIVHFVGGG